MGNHFAVLHAANQCQGDQGGPGWNGLSNKEKQAVKKTMKKLSENVSENGQQLFLRFFKAYPNYKDYFPSFRELQVDELRGSIVLRAHGTMVIHTLTTIIDKIDDYHVFRTTLHTNIRSHFKRGIRIHNYEAMFRIFAQFLKDRLGDQLDSVTHRAWDKVACMILEVMSDAIMEQGLIHDINNKSKSHHQLLGGDDDMVDDVHERGMEEDDDRFSEDEYRDEATQTSSGVVTPETEKDCHIHASKDFEV